MYKRILASLAIPMFAVAMAVAQSSSSSGSYPSSSGQTSAQPSSPSSPDQPSAASPNSPSSSDQNATTSQSTTTTSTTSSTTTANKGKEKTVRGCIEQQASDFYLRPIKGNKGLIKLNSSEDLKAHVGHEVKVTGAESKIASAGASTSGEMASNQSSASGSSASSMPQSDVNASANATREIQVSKIDMVSDTCSLKSTSDNTNKGAGTTTPPPQK